MWKTLETIGTTGSEDGIIIQDEEYNEACRITLEECSDRYAITCGIYGHMVHTEYVDKTIYQKIYNLMKSDLQLFVDDAIDADNKEEFFEHFIMGDYFSAVSEDCM